MNTPSRNISWMLGRTSLALLLLSLAGFVVWTAGDLLGQPPAQKKRREEEEEPPKAKTPKKKRPAIIPVEQSDDPPQAKSASKRPPGPAESGELAKLAEQATQPAVKALFRSLAIPYDRVRHQKTISTINGQRQQREYNIKPTPFLLGTDPGRFRNERLRFIPYTLDWQDDNPISVDPGSQLESVTPYEQIAQQKVRDFLKDSTPAESSDSQPSLSRYDKLVAAEQVLSAVLLWHKSARLRDLRRGKEWQSVEADLDKQLLDEVLLKQMDVLAQSQDWDRVLELAHRLAAAYTDSKQRAAIFRPIAGMITRALGGAISNEKEKQNALRRLRELEREFPDSSAFRPLAETLDKQAQFYVDEAKKLAENKQMARAREYLLQAQEIAPQLDGVRQLEIELNLEHPILRVGVRGQLPKYFSPAWACTDNEHRAMEMLFESLVKLVPDKAGGYRYGRGLSESYPRVVPLGRHFKLPIKAYWSNKKQLNATDIVTSVKLLQKGLGVGRSRVWGDLLTDPERKKNFFQITLPMRQGFLDPLALMTFKIVPRDRDDVNSEEFAQNPVTSGPFYFDPSRQSDEKGIECKIFLANRDYRLRPSKKNTPHIQEIRFYNYSNAVEELSKGRLDLFLDLTAKEAQELAKNSSVEVPSPSHLAPNRRIYFLAINTHQLIDADARRALSFAIDREALLNKHFRGPLKDSVHKVLNGPFPVGSWACKRDPNAAAGKGGPKLYDPARAQVLKAQPTVLAAAKARSWKLKYPEGDPALVEALKDMCARIKELTGLVLVPTPCTPYQLRDDVEKTKNYDVAYYHYDFPDESYWLAPLFGPPPGMEDESNMFQYQTADLSRLLRETKNYRDFTTVQQHQWEMQALLTHEFPFVPLWQLDPLLAYRGKVRPAGLDPLLVFDNIEDWHLLGK